MHLLAVTQTIGGADGSGELVLHRVSFAPPPTSAGGAVGQALSSWLDTARSPPAHAAASLEGAVSVVQCACALSRVALALGLSDESVCVATGEWHTGTLAPLAHVGEGGPSIFGIGRFVSKLLTAGAGAPAGPGDGGRPEWAARGLAPPPAGVVQIVAVEVRARDVPLFGEAGGRRTRAPPRAAARRVLPLPKSARSPRRAPRAPVACGPEARAGGHPRLSDPSACTCGVRGMKSAAERAGCCASARGPGRGRSGCRAGKQGRRPPPRRIGGRRALETPRCAQRARPCATGAWRRPWRTCASRAARSSPRHFRRVAARRAARLAARAGVPPQVGRRDGAI